MQIPDSIHQDISKIQSTDFHSKTKSVLKNICHEEYLPDMISYQSTLERRKLIENDPLLKSIRYEISYSN